MTDRAIHHPKPVVEQGMLLCSKDYAPVVLQEGGYVRTWSTKVVGTNVVAFFNGPADFFDEGDGNTYLICRTCLTLHDFPDDMGLDWQ